MALQRFCSDVATVRAVKTDFLQLLRDWSPSGAEKLRDFSEPNLALIRFTV